VTGLEFSGTTEKSARITLFEGLDSLGTGNANGEGAWTVTTTPILAEGSHEVFAKAEDLAGNFSSGSASIPIEIDTTPPDAPSAPDLAAADDKGTLDTDNITNLTTGLTISGNVEALGRAFLLEGSTVIGSFPANGLGSWSGDIGLSEGSHSITAVAMDVAGNLSESLIPIVITVDSTAPTLKPEIAAANRLVVQNINTSSFYTDEPGITVSSVANGRYFDLTLTDTAGNETKKSYVYCDSNANCISKAIEDAVNGDLVYIVEETVFLFSGGNHIVFNKTDNQTITLRGKSKSVVIRTGKNGVVPILMAVPTGSATLVLDTMTLGHLNIASNIIIGSSASNGTIRLKNITKNIGIQAVPLVSVACAVERWTGSSYVAPTDGNTDNDDTWVIGTNKVFQGVNGSTYWQ
jgi:hypothetical protein